MKCDCVVYVYLICFICIHIFKKKNEKMIKKNVCIDFDDVQFFKDLTPAGGDIFIHDNIQGAK